MGDARLAMPIQNYTRFLDISGHFDMLFSRQPLTNYIKIARITKIDSIFQILSSEAGFQNLNFKSKKAFFYSD